MERLQALEWNQRRSTRQREEERPMTDTQKQPDWSAFEHLDFTPEEALHADDLLCARQGRRRDGRVCACGHPMTRHAILNGLVYCKPTRMECPCKRDRPVLTTSDTRPFLRKTEGQGAMHALGRGLLAASRDGHQVEWLSAPECDRCHAQGPVSPVPVTQQGVAVNEATGYDALLCAKCRTQV